MEKCNLKLFFKQVVLNKVKNIIFLGLPFILMDLYIRFLADGVNYNMRKITFPSILFTLIWIGLILSVVCCLKRNTGRIIYSICFLFFFLSFIPHTVYYPYTGFFFNLNLLQSAEEGRTYIWDVVKQVDFLTVFSIILTLLSAIFAFVKFPETKKNKWITLIIVFLVFTVLHILTPSFLGRANSSLEWDTWRNPRNVYESFSDSNKCIKVCGFFEYSVRDLYISFIKSGDKIDPEELEFLKKAYSTKTPHKQNSYTGIFEGKNVIFLQLEGIDSWLLNENDMPNLYGMYNNSIIFKNHYSYYSGGGSTFNSELAVTTGFLTPISYTKNAYSFNQNLYPESLPKLFKKAGYRANAFHMNSGEYYMRELNYLNWGYDNYYSLLDDGAYKDISYQLDRELVLNEFFYDKLFRQKEPFMHYIISYTPHTPFSLESKMGKFLARKVFGEDVEIPIMTEEETARFFAAETDRMIGLLLEALEENNLIDNTVIVAFADHYLYTLNDKTILDQYKFTGNNLINQTPFLIWSKGLKSRTVEKINSQLDILPTVLNLFGIPYIDENYIGSDVMDINYSGYVFFSDYSWFDGSNYVEYGESVNNPGLDDEYIHEANNFINNLIKKNDLTLKYDYFKLINATK